MPFRLTITAALILLAVLMAAACAGPDPTPEPAISPTATVAQEPTSTVKPTSEPTATAVPEPTPSPTPVPTATPEPTPVPESTAAPTPAPTNQEAPLAAAQPDPRDVVVQYIGANGQTLVIILAEYLVNEHATLKAVPESELIESIEGSLEWDVVDIQLRDSQTVVTNTATMAFTVTTEQTPKVKVTVEGTVPFLFYVQGTEVPEFDVLSDAIEIVVGTGIGF